MRFCYTDGHLLDEIIFKADQSDSIGQSLDKIELGSLDKRTNLRCQRAVIDGPFEAISNGLGR